MYKIVDNTIKVKKVSIIIPIYGVELFIERCAISLFEQTLDDIEYIFVDDCTMDKSVQILQGIIAKYPQRKDNVFIIRHERNKGLASARKTGLKFVHGEYVAHCDSDDWLKGICMSICTKKRYLQMLILYGVIIIEVTENQKNNFNEGTT